MIQAQVTVGADSPAPHLEILNLTPGDSAAYECQGGLGATLGDTFSLICVFNTRLLIIFVFAPSSRLKLLFEDGHQFNVSSQINVRREYRFRIVVRHLLARYLTFLDSQLTRYLGSDPPSTPLVRVNGAPVTASRLRVPASPDLVLELACTDMGGFPPPSILWFRDHTPLRWAARVSSGDHWIWALSRVWPH